MELLTSAALLSLIVVLLVRALRQRNALPALKPQSAPLSGAVPSVAVIVPARNEAANVGPCLLGLVSQRYPAERLSILAIDDESDDGTDRILMNFARAHANVRSLKSGPLRRGWTGKSQACWRGAAAAPGTSEWLCFIDADMRAEPWLIASAVAAAAPDVALISLAPRHRLVSFAERLMIPCGLYLLGFRQDLPRAQAQSASETSVAGQFMLVRREAYDEAGGHAAVASAICEDLELARLLKRRGRRVLMMNGSRLLSTRMYRGWSDLWPGFTKNVLDTFGGTGPALATAATAVIVSWALVLLPALDYVGCRAGTGQACAALTAALPAALIAIGFHASGAIYFGAPIWYGLLFPIGYSVGGLIALDALRRRLTGRVSWKGRVYS